ncbi:MAG: hypothetical protein EPN85_07685 [Bacteroidetes bacterium]|nr:MAG: hypothetical protein EPN85_07685 [Bacteroidota bacterium]
MNNPVNLFLISTPLQLINVIEAKKELNISNESSVVIFMAYSINLTVIKKIIDPTLWKEIYFINEDLEALKKHEENFKKRRLFAVFRKAASNFSKIKKIVKQFERVDNLIVGYYLNLENLHVMNSVKFNKLYLLDDGVATIDINNRRKNNWSFFKNQSWELYFKMAFKKYFLNYRIKHPPAACFFTIYDIKQGLNDQVIRHTYKEVKKQIKGLSKTDEVFFLGGSYSEVHPEMLIETEYFDYLSKISNYFKPKHLIYVPHKDESSEKLERIKSDLNITVRVIELPIELFLLNQKEMPKTISGMTTSALPNCKEIFGEEIEIVAIKINSEKVVNKSSLAVLDEVYGYFDKISDDKFKVVSLD